MLEGFSATETQSVFTIIEKNPGKSNSYLMNSSMMPDLKRKKRPSPGRMALWSVTALLMVLTLGWMVLAGGPAPMERKPIDPALGADQTGLDLNTASAAALEELPGIGPALAERIVAWREEHGPFSGPEELQAVPGIGPATAEAIAPYIAYE